MFDLGQDVLNSGCCYVPYIICALPRYKTKQKLFNYYYRTKNIKKNTSVSRTCISTFVRLTISFANGHFPIFSKFVQIEIFKSKIVVEKAMEAGWWKLAFEIGDRSRDSRQRTTARRCSPQFVTVRHCSPSESLVLVVAMRARIPRPFLCITCNVKLKKWLTIRTACSRIRKSPRYWTRRRTT